MIPFEKTAGRKRRRDGARLRPTAESSGGAPVNSSFRRWDSQARRRRLRPGCQSMSSSSGFMFHNTGSHHHHGHHAESPANPAFKSIHAQRPGRQRGWAMLTATSLSASEGQNGSPRHHDRCRRRRCASWTSSSCF